MVVNIQIKNSFPQQQEHMITHNLPNPNWSIIRLEYGKIFIIINFIGFFVYTYIHNWSLQPISQVDSEQQIFWEPYHGSFYLLSEFLPEICWEEIAEEILFVFYFDVWPGARTLALRLISQHYLPIYWTAATSGFFVLLFKNF